jgi:hypothetical protein
MAPGPLHLINQTKCCISEHSPKLYLFFKSFLFSNFRPGYLRYLAISILASRIEQTRN